MEYIAMQYNILEPNQFENLYEEVEEEEEELHIFASFMSKTWQRLDDEPSCDDYYKYL
jgi:hypothetical protein